MEQNAAVRMVQNLYEQKNYLGAAQASLDLIKDPELAKQGYLIFIKAFLYLIPNIQDEEKLDTLFSSVQSLGAYVESAEEAFVIEAEICGAYEEWTRDRFANIIANLENNPISTYWQAFIHLPVKYIEKRLILHAAFRGNPHIKELLSAEGDRHIVEEKYKRTYKEFTNEDLHEMLFNAACRIHPRFINYVQDNMDGSAEYVKSQTKAVFDRLYTLDLIFGYCIPDAGKGDDKIIISREKKHIEFIKDALDLRMYPNGREMCLLLDDTRKKWQKELTVAKKAISDAEKRIAKAEEEEKRKRVVAYWEAHASEKKQFDTELKELKKRIKELNGPITKAQDDVEKLQHGKKEKLPIEQDCDKQRQLIKDLETERSKCGLFKGKQKKALTERLNSVEYPRLAEMEKEAEKKIKERDKNIDTQVAGILKSIEPQIQEKQNLVKRKEEIEHELTRDR